MTSAMAAAPHACCAAGAPDDILEWVVKDGGITTSAAHTLVFDIAVLGGFHNSTYAPLMLAATCLAWEGHQVGLVALDVFSKTGWSIHDNDFGSLIRMPGALLGYVMVDMNTFAKGEGNNERIDHGSYDFLQACMLVR